MSHNRNVANHNIGEEKKIYFLEDEIWNWL